MSSESTAVSWNRADTDTRTQVFADTAAVFDDVQAVLGRKWHLRIVYHLLNEPMGFSTLKDEISGISAKMLSEGLTRLESDGLVDRDVVSDQPVRVEYSLTERGRALEPAVSALVDWGAEYGPKREGE